MSTETFSPECRWSEETFAHHYDRWMRASPLSRAMYERVAELTCAESPSAVLDCGCGSGILAEAIVRRSPTASVWALDASTAMLRLASRQGCQRVHLIRHDVSQPLPFRAGVFDSIAAVNVLWTLPCPHAFLQEAARCLRRHGHLVLVHPVRMRASGPLVRGHLRALGRDARMGRLRTVTRIVSALPSALFLLRWNSVLDERFVSGAVSLASEAQVLAWAEASGFTHRGTEHALENSSLVMWFQKEAKDAADV